jgi:hypothetical protein
MRSKRVPQDVNAGSFDPAPFQQRSERFQNRFPLQTIGLVKNVFALRMFLLKH